MDAQACAVAHPSFDAPREVLGENLFAMLRVQSFFKTFTNKSLAAVHDPLSGLPVAGRHCG
jgi:hypothetical protein